MASRRVLILLGIALAVTGCSESGGSDGHAPDPPRIAAEEPLEQEMAEWPAYLTARGEACESSDQAFTYAVGMHVDDGTLDRFRSDVRYLCPECMDRLEETVEGLGDPDGESAPCTDE